MGQKGVVECEKLLPLPKGLTPKVMSKIKALYLVVEQVFKDIYKLDLPPEIKVHPTFHVSLLKLLKKDALWPDCKQVIRPPPNQIKLGKSSNWGPWLGGALHKTNKPLSHGIVWAGAR